MISSTVFFFFLFVLKESKERQHLPIDKDDDDDEKSEKKRKKSRNRETHVALKFLLTDGSIHLLFVAVPQAGVAMIDATSTDRPVPSLPLPPSAFRIPRRPRQQGFPPSTAAAAINKRRIVSSIDMAGRPLPRRRLLFSPGPFWFLQQQNRQPVYQRKQK